MVRVGQAQETVSNTSQIPLDRNELLVARTGVFAELQRMDTSATGIDSVFAVPYTLIGWDNAVARAFTPIFIPQGLMRYQAVDDHYTGSFLLGVEDASDRGALRRLGRPIGITIGGDADSLLPHDLRFDSAGTAPHRVRVVARTPHDSVRVLLVPRFAADSVALWLPVERSLTFELPPAEIQGWGVESATLRIGVRGTARPDSFTVSLASDRGTVHPDQLRIGPSGGSVKLLSGGALGPTRVRATVIGFAPAEATIRFGFPWLSLGATLLGAVLGAAFMAYRRSGTGSTIPTGRFIAGTALGAFLATVIYLALDINLLQVPLKAELGTPLALMAFSALGAIVGLSTLSPSKSAGDP